MKRILFVFTFSFALTGCMQHIPAISHNRYTLASERLHFRTTCYDSSDLVFINVHENESTSVEAWRREMKSLGQHCLVELQHEKLRLISFSYEGQKYSVDPNRIYTSTGLMATLNKYNEAYSEPVFNELSRMAAHITAAFIDNKKLVVALHNNTDGNFSAKSYLPGGVEAINAADVYLNEARDEDDFFYTTEKVYFDFFKSRGYNAVWQDNRGANDDGSLSIYCAQKNIPYINIEAENGHLAEQREMLETLQQLIHSLDF